MSVNQDILNEIESLNIDSKLKQLMKTILEFELENDKKLKTAKTFRESYRQMIESFIKSE